jgi:hypothetical protein
MVSEEMANVACEGRHRGLDVNLLAERSSPA